MSAGWAGPLRGGAPLGPAPMSLKQPLGRRGDHTYAECCLTVVARSTEAVVFSIDGSFTASVSIMGSDPKVRAGAVDVVR